MIKKAAIPSVVALVAILFAILFQSVHSIEHYQKELNDKHCYHERGVSDYEITHQHTSFDHCPICDFTFNSFVESEVYGINYPKLIVDVVYFSYAFEIPFFYSGSLDSNRGPPTSNC